MGQGVRVLVVDDHEIVRRGVRSLLQEAGIEACGEAVDGSDAILKVQELKPDVVVMDVSMPNRNGIEATIEVVQRFPGTRVVILSQYDFPHIVAQAIHAVASAYVVKSANFHRLDTCSGEHAPHHMAIDAVLVW